MTTDEITWGETYDLELAAQDENGTAITLDGTYTAAARITKDRVGGETVATIGG